MEIKDTTMFGGKPYPLWENAEMELPGYKNATLSLKNNKTNAIVNIGFMISPTGMQEQRSTVQQTNKTMAGWFVQRSGSNLTSLALSGYMLDTRDVNERLTFVERYLQYFQDARNDKLEYFNDWETTLFIEGRKYSGFLQGLSLSKNGNQQFLYQYNLSFISYVDVQLYQPKDKYAKVAQNALDIMGGGRTDNSQATDNGVVQEAWQITTGLYGVLKGE